MRIYTFTSQIGFDIALTNVEATLKQSWDNIILTLKQHCATLKNGDIDVAQSWFNVVSTLGTENVSMLRNVENPILDFVLFSTSNQRYLNGNLQCCKNVDQTLKCWKGSIYENFNSKYHSACKFTNKIEL